MTVNDLPIVNASLNALSTVFIIAGLVFIKAERKVAHITCMAIALLTSTVFLACYLTYHYTAGHTEFTHQGWPRVLYFLILVTHIPLAIGMLPFIILVVTRALQAKYESHKKWARIVAPVWLYVSFTGVLVYLMLYVWFPPVKVAG